MSELQVIALQSKRLIVNDSWRHRFAQTQRELLGAFALYGELNSRNSPIFL